MGKSSAFENDLLKLVFNATPIANIADNAASSPLTNLSVALHTADPGVGGTQSTNEVAYTGYARATVARTSAGWTVTGNSVSPVSSVAFPLCSGGSSIATFFSVGVPGGGATKVLYSGTVTPNISIATGVTPQLTPASTITEG